MRLTPLLVAGLSALLPTASAYAHKRPPPPTLETLQTVWVGGSDGGTVFVRLDVQPGGAGLLTVYWGSSKPARAYRLLRTQASAYRVAFHTEPIDDDAEPILLFGHGMIGDLELEMRGVRTQWKLDVMLQPFARLMERIDAVTSRADEVSRRARD